MTVASTTAPSTQKDDTIETHDIARRTDVAVYARIYAAANNPHSVPNLLAALRDAGLKARITRLGDPPHERGHIQVEMPVKGRARFVLQGERATTGRMHWRSAWDGNESKAGLKRYAKSVRTPDYAAMIRIMRDGRFIAQLDLFA